MTKWSMRSTSCLTLVTGEPLPSMAPALGLLALGASAYRLSLRFYLLAQRSFGAARTASVFTFAPFIGAALTILLGDRAGGWAMLVVGGLMLLVVLFHLMESHHHEHFHTALKHEHIHTHDDGHHDHAHEVMPTSIIQCSTATPTCQIFITRTDSERVLGFDSGADGQPDFNLAVNVVVYFAHLSEGAPSCRESPHFFEICFSTFATAGEGSRSVRSRTDRQPARR